MYSWGRNLGVVRTEVRTEVKKDLEVGQYDTFGRELQGNILVTAEELGGECNVFTRETRREDTTVEVALAYSSERRPRRRALAEQVRNARYCRKKDEQTLKAKFFKACATPGCGSYRLPALTRKVTAVVGWPLSMAATFMPDALESTTVANERARRLAVDAREANMT